ncbi:MAG TPA: hypothetical protein VD996_09665 [Chitinophagaceae bacterium]|nr:hypothetical protein [Chitinophagaceae bacterium]
MKRLVTSLLAIMLITVAAQAQDKKDGGKHHRKDHQRAFSQQLNFSEEQKAQLKLINEDFRKQMTELKKNENITVKEQKEKRKAIVSQHQSKMQSLLTAEQKAKLEQMKQERKNKVRTDVRKGDRKERFAKKDRGARLKTELGLTDEQTKKMEAARADFSAKAKSIRENTSLTDAQKKEQMKALAGQHKETTKSILTKEQQEKMQSMRSHRQHKPKTEAL